MYFLTKRIGVNGDNSAVYSGGAGFKSRLGLNIVTSRPLRYKSFITHHSQLPYHSTLHNNAGKKVSLNKQRINLSFHFVLTSTARIILYSALNKDRTTILLWKG